MGGITQTHMEIVRIAENRKQYLDLLLLADEQEDMIDRYLERGEMYALEDGGVKAVCVVTDEGDGVLELKNLAVEPAAQRKGYGKALIAFLLREYRTQYAVLQVGTGDSPLTIPFYEACGFTRSHVVRNFFIDHYDHPIFEGGVQLAARECSSGRAVRGACTVPRSLWQSVLPYFSPSVPVLFILASEKVPVKRWHAFSRPTYKMNNAPKKN